MKKAESKNFEHKLHGLPVMSRSFLSASLISQSGWIRQNALNDLKNFQFRRIPKFRKLGIAEKVFAVFHHSKAADETDQVLAKQTCPHQIDRIIVKSFWQVTLRTLLECCKRMA